MAEEDTDRGQFASQETREMRIDRLMAAHKAEMGNLDSLMTAKAESQSRIDSLERELREIVGLSELSRNMLSSGPIQNRVIGGYATADADSALRKYGVLS